MIHSESGLALIHATNARRVQTFYQSSNNEILGKQYGTELTNVMKVVAKPGYVVGAITVKSGLGIDGLSITFMKLAKDTLDPKDTYESDWIGGKGGGRPTKLGGDGTPVVGLLGKANDKDLTGLGLIYFGDKGSPTQIQGGGVDPEFKDMAPDKGLLVGMEVGLGKFGNNDVVRAIRPIYRVGTTETLGDQRGTEITRVQKVVAKPGYAVGAVSVKAGLGVDGLSITFMKVTDAGGLDSKDSYESPWIGGMGCGGPAKLGGDGTSVIGIVGKVNKKDMTGLGLLMKEP